MGESTMKLTLAGALAIVGLVLLLVLVVYHLRKQGGAEPEQDKIG
jgi:hypothetical protein